MCDQIAEARNKKRRMRRKRRFQNRELEAYRTSSNSDSDEFVIPQRQNRQHNIQASSDSNGGSNAENLSSNEQSSGDEQQPGHNDGAREMIEAQESGNSHEENEHRESGGSQEEDSGSEHDDGLGDDVDQNQPPHEEPQQELQQHNLIDLHSDDMAGTGSEAQDSLGSESSATSAESSDSDNGDIPPAQGNQRLLFPGAPLTIDESLLAILTFSVSHQLSGVGIANLLNLISLHCPPNNLCLSSYHMFKKYFNNMGNSVFKLHFYCSSCVYPVREKNGECDICHRGNNTSYFIEMPIKDQLAGLFQRDGFYEKLQYRFNRRKLNENNYEDIYDGELYQKQLENNGFLSGSDNISLLGYTDGVSVFSTSTNELWPLCFQINELPYKDRVQKENIILAGLWCSSKKPAPNVYLQPFHTSLNEFKNNGFNLFVHGQGQKLIKGMMLGFTCDLPAKAKFMRMAAHNGTFGCSRCEIPGERFPVGRTTIQVYPYSDVMFSRNHDETRIYAEQARQLRRRDADLNVRGVKGLSLLYEMVPDFIRSAAIDAMHGCFLGLSKLLVNLWFNSTLSDEPFSLYHVLDLVDSRLNKISPPSNVQRMPRSIRNQLSYWKALEYKMFLLYYSVLVLKGLMDEPYYTHHCKIVSAIFLLSADSVSAENIQRASELIIEYVREFQQLYGLRWLTLNVHQLLHLHEVVLDLGPLWVYSCFTWEDLNGKLARLVHGTRYAGLQIAKASSYVMHLPFFVNEMQESPARLYCKGLLSSHRKVKVAEVISDTDLAVGSYKFYNAVPVQLQVLLQTSCDLVGGR